MSFRLLIVEDDAESHEQYQLYIEEFASDKPIEFDVKTARSFDEADSLTSRFEFDGAVVDLKLRTDGNEGEFEGNRLIEEFTSTVRCPVIVYSANHMNLSEDARKRVFKVFSRDDVFNDVLQNFYLIQECGLPEIMKKKGLIEGYLDQIYWDVISERIDTWTEYSLSGRNTKNAMLRLILNHLIELIGQDHSKYFPDEAYLTISTETAYKTGQLFKDENTNSTYMIISPACDLVIHQSGPKSEFIQLCRVYGHREEPVLSHIQKADAELPPNTDPDYERLRLERKASCSFLKNGPSNGADFYHYLPKSGLFDGGVINFREVLTVTRETMSSNYRPLGIQVSAPFLKDIVGRYSSYYSRQGQPVFDFGELRPEELLRL